MQLTSTKDYSLFTLVKSNREVIPSHVDKIKASIKEKNLLAQNPITVNSKMQVIDGQHRLAAAQALGIEIYYIVSDEVTNEDISRLNTNKRNWGLTDYLNFWHAEGKEEYKKIGQFLNNHPRFTLTAALLILGGDYTGYTQTFKDGRFVVKDKDWAEQFAEQVKELHEYGKHVYMTEFIRRYYKVAKNEKFDFKKLIHQINKGPKSFMPCVNDKQYAEMFNEIFNRDIPSKNHVIFK
jgi:hypothetical protein